MASTVILAAAGLVTSPNQLNQPEGSLSEATNVVIRRNGIIEQRRGFKVFGNELPTGNQRVKQVAFYRDRILRHYSNKLQFDSTGEGRFLDFEGEVIEAEAGLRLKSIESKGNFYFTTREGIKKLSARNSLDLTNIQIENAGVEKALDVEASLNLTQGSQTDFFPQDSKIAYRVVWNKEDNNANLITGSPSQNTVVTFPMTNSLVKDFMFLLETLDSLTNTPLTTARINNKNYINNFEVSYTSPSSSIRSAMISLAEAIDNDIYIASQAVAAPLQITGVSLTGITCTVTFNIDPSPYLSVGKRIELKGFNPTALNNKYQIIGINPSLKTITFNVDSSIVPPVSLSGTAQIFYAEYRSIPEPVIPNVPALNLDLVSLQTYLKSIMLKLQAEPSTIIATGGDKDLINELDVTTTGTVNLKFTIPNGVTTNYFYQVYRSSITQAVQTAILEDLFPNDEMQLVYEAFPTQEEINRRFIEVEDIQPEAFRGENLYTNQSSGEGITQANDIPPFATDINRYKGSIFYSNTRTKHRMLLDLIGVTRLIEDYNNNIIPKISITNGLTTNTYKFVTGIKEKVTIQTVADSPNNFLNGKSFVLPSATGKKYRVYFETTTASDPSQPGEIPLKVKISTGASNNDVAQALSNKITTLIDDFTSSHSGNIVTVINTEFGEVLDVSSGNTTFSVNIVDQGQGEKIQPEITKITTIAGNLFTNSGTSDYITINSTDDQDRFVIWFKRGTAINPILSGVTLLELEVEDTDSAIVVAQKIFDLIPSSLFKKTISSNEVTIENIKSGECTPVSENVFNNGFLVQQIQEGGINVLLSTVTSVGQAVDETARSLIRVINKNEGDGVYGFYLSGPRDRPGRMFLESRDLNDIEPFYVSCNNNSTGISFSPDISPELQITSISTGANTVTIETSTPHSLQNGDIIFISSTDCKPIVDGIHSVKIINPTTFTISGFVSLVGTTGSVTKRSTSYRSENDDKANRVYYSKPNQPEAVPIVNYFELGSSDKKILRIQALRDSLFVFKEDGLFRVSGEGIPFQSELFDNSFILLAPDSLAVCNNVIYAWTTQGIQALSEGGASVISRNIDNVILKTQSINYVNFKTTTWGVGYESDNSYIVFTVKNPEDEVAEIAYRYSTLTNTWSTYDKTNTCGVINARDDKLYMGAGDIANTEVERKSFSRLDYADREYSTVLSGLKIRDNKIILSSVAQFDIGDVLVQDQTLTVYEFNMLLKKLDMDSGPADTDYFTSLQAKQGSNLRNQLIFLAEKLDQDVNVTNIEEYADFASFPVTGALGIIYKALDTGDFYVWSSPVYNLYNYQSFKSSIETKSGTISFISDDNPTQLTSIDHGLITGRKIRILDSNSNPNINGEHIVTVIDKDTFTISILIKGEGTYAVWNTLDNDFDDIKACYNKIISMLNENLIINFNNYRALDNTTIQESIILDINRVTRELTLNLNLEYVVGAATVYKSIPAKITYSPNTFGDPLNLKHLREATLMFETRTLTLGDLSFATDLLPEMVNIPFKLDGNGIFGHQPFGSNYFGGLSNSAPFRTYIPRQCQRCRFIITSFTHKVAREDWRLLGVTMTGETGQSTRAFR